MRSKLKARNAASADAAGSVMPTCAGAVDRVEHREHERADLLGPLAADDVAHLGGEVGRARGCRARTASSKSWQTYAMRSAHATTSPSGVAGGGTAPRVVADAVERLAAQVERRERDVGAVDRVVVAGLGEVRRERLLGRVAGGAVPAVVGSAIASTSGRHRLAARAMPVATCATSTACVSRVRRWSSSGAMNTWHLPARRRHGRECFTRSRSRSKHRRYGSGSSGRARSPAPTGRVAPGAKQRVDRSASRSSRDTTPPPTNPCAPSVRAPNRAAPEIQLCSGDRGA